MKLINNALNSLSASPDSISALFGFLPRLLFLAQCHWSILEGRGITDQV